MKYIYLIFRLFIPILALGLFSVQSASFRISDFPGYEFYKYNFNYHNRSELNPLKDPSRVPVYSLSFQEMQSADLGNPNIPVHWDVGVSGMAPRFYGQGSEYPLSGWDSFFSQDRLSSFTLSFYFRPQTVMREESLLEGMEENSQGENMFPTAFRILLRNGYVHWELKNFFTLKNKKFSQALVSRLPFRPGDWNHLVLGYDIHNARLTMTLNGEVVDFAYATTDGRKSGSQYIAGFSSSEDRFGQWVMSRGERQSPAIQPVWVLGRGYTGMIDEVEFFNDRNPVPTRFQIGLRDGATDPYSSVYASRVFRLNKNTRIDMARIQGQNIDTTYIRLYLCHSRDFFPERINFSDCPQISWDRESVNVSPAEFYQFFLVYNNLEHAFKSISALEFFYSDDDPPLPPQWVTLEQNRQGLLLEWKYTLDEVEGYRIYFRSGDFQGEKNMIQLNIAELRNFKTRRELWTYVIEDLEMDTQYFLGIKSFDFRDGQVRESNFSLIKSFYYSSNFFN